MRFISVGPVIGLFLVIACDGRHKTCEDARDVFVAESRRLNERAMAEAPLDAVAQVKAAGHAETKASRAVFVEQCKRLDDASLACVGRLDEFFKLREQRQSARDACPNGDNDLPDAECISEHEVAIEQLGPCRQKLGLFLEAVWATSDL